MDQSLLPKTRCFVCKVQHDVPSNAEEESVQLNKYQKLLGILEVKHQLPKCLKNFQQCCPACFQSITQICDFHDLIQSIQMEMKELVDKLTAASKNENSLDLDSPTTSTVIEIDTFQSDHFQEEIHAKSALSKTNGNEEHESDPPTNLSNVQSVKVIAQKFKCKLCGMSFTAQISENRHMQTIHEKLKAYKCQLCSKSYFRNDILTRHMRTQHNYVKSVKSVKQPTPRKAIAHKFKCKLCELTFTTQYSEIRHRKTIHEKLKAYKCQLCSIAYFRNSDELTKHMKSHNQQVISISDFSNLSSSSLNETQSTEFNFGRSMKSLVQSDTSGSFYNEAGNFNTEADMSSIDEIDVKYEILREEDDNTDRSKF